MITLKLSRLGWFDLKSHVFSLKSSQTYTFMNFVMGLMGTFKKVINNKMSPFLKYKEDRFEKQKLAKSE